jgi:hypothetical protein
MKLRRVVLVSTFLLAAAACGPSSVQENETTDTSTEAVEVVVNTPLIDPAAVNVTFQFQPPTQWQGFANDLETLAKPFKELASIISSINTALAGAEVVLKLFGFLKPPPDQFALLAQRLDERFNGLSWQMTANTVNPEMVKMQNALDQIRSNTLQGLPFNGTDSNSFYKDAMAAIQNLEGIGSVFPPFQRVFNEGATDDSTSNWKGIIAPVAGATRPVVTNGLVYDWRLHVPAIIKAIPQQLAILAAVDGAFGTNPAYNFRVNRSRTALLQQYDNMYKGLVCGTKDELMAVDSRSSKWGCKLACADMHTGFSGSRSIPPIARTDARGNVTGYVEGCKGLAASPEGHAEYKYSVLEIRAGIAKRMPFFSVKSLADSLYRVTNPAPDLTELNQRINLEADQNLCIEVESAQAVDGTPVWLAPCNGTTAQWWTYSRNTGRIYNPGLDKCLSIHQVGRGAQLASPPAPGELISLYAYPAVIATCAAVSATLEEQVPQRWTFDPQHLVLQNAIGPEATLTAATIAPRAALVVRGVIGQPQAFNLANQWHLDGGSLGNNHPLMVAPGPAAGGGLALDGESIYWGQSAGGFVEKTTLGQAFSTSHLAAGESSPWAIAINAKNVYWTNFSIGGAVKMMPKSGDLGGGGDPTMPPPPPLVIAQESGRPAGIAVDATYVYYTTSTYQGTPGTGTVKRANLNGGGVVTLASGQLDPSYIAVDATNVYFTNWGSSSTVMKGGRNPGEPVVTLVSGQSCPADIKVDATSVYWVNACSGQIMKVSKSGGNPVVLASDQTSAINLAIDGTSLYWVNNAQDGKVMTVGVNGGAPVTLAKGLKAPYLMATDSTYAYFATNESPKKIHRVSKTQANLAPTPAAPPACASGTTLLAPGQGLIAGTSQSEILTCGGQYWLAMQTDGNLVLYQAPMPSAPTATPLWASNTVGSFGDRVVMQGDGNLVIYTPAGNAVWSSGTGGHPGVRLAINGTVLSILDDVNLRNLWSTGGPTAPSTCGRMNAGQGLAPGASVVSCNGRYVLMMQYDGNLVLSDTMGGAIWSTGTAGNLIFASVTLNGLFVYAPYTALPLWQSSPTPSGTLISTWVELADTGNMTVVNRYRTTFNPLTQTRTLYSTNTASTGSNLLASFASDQSWTPPTATYAMNGLELINRQPVGCAGNKAVNGAGCAGNRCSIVNLECSTPPPGTSVNTNVVGWMSWFSDEGSTTAFQSCVNYSDGTAPCVSQATDPNLNQKRNMGVCPGPDAVMTGIKCTGSNSCDNVEVQCNKLATGHVDRTRCSWTPWASEEIGARLFTGSFLTCPSSDPLQCTACGTQTFCNYFAIGVQCRGDYCDDKSYRVCPVVP